MTGETPADREEWRRRFKARLLELAGAEVFEDGSSIADYAEMTAAAYLDDDFFDWDTPEAAAESDYSYWGE